MKAKDILLWLLFLLWVLFCSRLYFSFMQFGQIHPWHTIQKYNFCCLHHSKISFYHYQAYWVCWPIIFQTFRSISFNYFYWKVFLAETHKINKTYDSNKMLKCIKQHWLSGVYKTFTALWNNKVDNIRTVSYTHLDVYKRQILHCDIFRAMSDLLSARSAGVRCTP